MPKGIFPQID